MGGDLISKRNTNLPYWPFLLDAVCSVGKRIKLFTIMKNIYNYDFFNTIPLNLNYHKGGNQLQNLFLRIWAKCYVKCPK